MRDLREKLAAKGVHTLVALFTDIHGVAKGKYVPLGHLDDLLTEGVPFAGASIAGSGLPRTGARSEYWARGYASTVRALPWQPGYAMVACDGWVEGQPFDACPRQVLRRQTARLLAQGWSLRVAVEPEFFLLKRHGDCWLPADDADRLHKSRYALESLSRQSDFLRELQCALQDCGIDVTQIDHEDAQGQYKINFGPADALAVADHLTLYRIAAHALAEARGMVFSTLPKPLPEQPGSGMHFTVSLWQMRRNNERNLFVPHRGDGSVDPAAVLSAHGQQFVAGVLAHSAALSALAVPSADGYTRLRAGPDDAVHNWAPSCIAHGPNNRTALVRTLHDQFEWRLPDASAHPYLASAGLIAAGLDGIERKLALPAAVTDDLFELTPAEWARRGIAELPHSLEAALDALRDDAVISRALGATLSAQWQQIKRAEVDDARRAMPTVPQ